MMLNIVLLAVGITGAYSQTTHTVQVGPSGSLVYDPPTVSAAVGDVVRYCFHPKSHSVTQSNFATPCEYNGGFDSDLTPIPADSPDCQHPYDVPVPDEKPIWIHCKQQTGLHCQHGMVGAINPPETGNTFANFQAAALALLNSTTTTAAPPATATPPPAGTDAPPPPPAAPVTHTITVGANHLKKFEPNNIEAAVNDVVRFVFVADNHTSTQSSLNDPCTALQGPDGAPAFDTGFQPINPSNPNQISHDFIVSDTKPKWGYCRQNGHCGTGMVWAVNGGDKFEQFLQTALALGNSTSATGGPSPSGAPSPTGGSSSNGANSAGSSAGATSGALSTKSVPWAMIGLFAATMAMF